MPTEAFQVARPLVSQPISEIIQSILTNEFAVHGIILMPKKPCNPMI